MSSENDVKERVEELESRVDELEKLLHEGDGEVEATGLREFVDQYDPQTHAERALAIGYYLEQYKGRDNFTRSDIEEGYRTCRTQKPANMSDVLASLEEKGWAMDDGTEGQSRLRRLAVAGICEIEGAGEDGT